MTLTITYIIAYYEICLVVVGTLLNGTVFAVCIRKRNNTTFIFLAMLAVGDALSLYFWNLNHFTTNVLNFNMQGNGLWGCRFVNFLQFSSLQISAWLLVLLTVDRLFSVRMKAWKTVYFRPQRAAITAACMVAFLILLNSHVLFTDGRIVPNNKTDVQIQCYTSDDDPSTSWMAKWNLAHSFLYSYIPFCLLAIINIMLILSIQSQKSSVISTSTSKTKRQRSLNRTVLFITALFIVMTFPCSIASIYYSELIVSSVGSVVLIALDSLTFSYHGLNFFVLLYTNKRFKHDFKALCCLWRKEYQADGHFLESSMKSRPNDSNHTA